MKRLILTLVVLLSACGSTDSGAGPFFGDGVVMDADTDVPDVSLLDSADGDANPLDPFDTLSSADVPSDMDDFPHQDLVVDDVASESDADWDTVTADAIVSDNPLSPDGAPCNDHDPCTYSDTWHSGVCEGISYQCQDDLVCTTATCDGNGSCAFNLDNGWCLIDGACRGIYELNPDDPTWLCDPNMDAGTWSARPLDGACDDGNDTPEDGCGQDHEVEAGWACSAISGQCHPLCGDGMVVGSEACDDANGTVADGCGAGCLLEAGARCEGSPSHCVPGPCMGITITYRGTKVLGDTTLDATGASVPLAGLSGLTHVEDSDFIAIMDNSNRLVRMRLFFSNDGTILSTQFQNGVDLAETHDFEGIAFPTASRNTVVLSEEDTPALRLYHLADGSTAGILPLPEVYSFFRENFGLESVASDPRDDTLWTANEEGLSVDAPLSTASEGTIVRLLRLASSGDVWEPAEQYAYQVEPLHGPTMTGARSGVSDLVVLPGGRLLVLERSLALYLPGLFETRIYEVSLGDATNVSSMPELLNSSYKAASKRLLWSGHLTNIEGLCLGPALGSGRWALPGVTDDGDPLSKNAVVAFELVIPPSCLPH